MMMMMMMMTTTTTTTTTMMMMTTMVKNLENLIPAHNHFLLQSSALLRSLFLRLQLVAETLSISNCRIFRVCLPRFFLKKFITPRFGTIQRAAGRLSVFFLLAKAVPFFLQHQRRIPVVIGSQIYSKSDGSRK